MFDSILIANRGEIACRVIRTARRLGVRTVAVYSEADAGALFVRQADQAIPIGAAPARDSYLRAERVLEAAVRTGAQAIHPGYGFLSENAEFAEACAAAGVAFIGPPPAAIRAMGLKDAAKATMEQAGVPVVPGYHGEEQSLPTLRAEAERIGWPVLIKAVAGGGGKGMRRVDRGEAFESALAAARREAEASFGDGRVLIEKFLVKPRHIEVQVFADSHGEAVHLFERDCSLQRRHQKVVEEAPAPGMPLALRESMGGAAVTAAKAIGYQGAGTVEFIVDVRNGLDQAPFYFMEMNTRLQVEHPVTEAVAGVDLVEWQLRVAAGERLPQPQHALCLSGHALEVRLYAEDPAREYLPQTGTLRHLRWPSEREGVRIDTGVVEGDPVSVHYDPMIAKLITHGEDRGQALARMRRALAELRVAGLTTNRALLRSIVAHPAFVAGDVDTGFLERHRTELIRPEDPARADLLPLVCAGALADRERRARRSASPSDPYSPWGCPDGFRLNEDGQDVLRFETDGTTWEVRVCFSGQGASLRWGEVRVRLERWSLGGAELTVSVDGLPRRASYVDDGEHLYVLTDDGELTVRRADPCAELDAEGAAGGLVKSPMPGKVIAVLVSEGGRVERGQPLLRLEAMKMEHTLSAPRTGVVEQLNAREGEQVDEGVTLLMVADSSDAG